MKTVVLRSTLAAALFSHSLCFAAAPEEPPVITEAAYAAARSAVLDDVYLDLFKPFESGQGNPIPQLERMTQQPHSPAVANMVRQSFGIPALYTVQRAPAQPGKVVFTLSSPARRFATVEQNAMAWGPLQATMELDTDGRTMALTSNWESLTHTDSQMTVSMSGISMTSAENRSARDIWLGTAVVRIARMVLGIGETPDAVTFEGTEVLTKVSEQGKLVDLGVEVGINSMAMFGEQVEKIRFVSRMTNVDMKEFETVTLSMGRGKSMLSASGDLSGQAKAAYVAFTKSAAANGSTMHFDEISAMYRGHKVFVSGTMSLLPVQDADFRNMQMLGKKINARFEIKLPLALVAEIAGTVARQKKPAPDQAAGDAGPAPEAAGQAMADSMVAQAVESGFASLSDGMLTSTLEIKRGAMWINGQPMDAKKPAKARAKPARRAARKAGK